MSQRIEPSFQYVWMNWTHLIDDSQNWTFFLWFDSIFFKRSQIIEFFSMTQRIEPLFYEPLFNMTQRHEVFFHLTQRIELKPFVFLKMSQRIEPLFHMSYFFTRLKELIFSNMTQRFFQIDSKELNPLFFHDSKKWPCFSKMTHSIEPFFSTWLKECNFVWLTQKNWTLCQKKSLKEWNFFLFWSKELFPFFFNLTRRIDHFFNMSQWFEPLSWISPTELNLFSIWLK